MNEEHEIFLEKAGLQIPITISKYRFFYHLSQQIEYQKRTCNVGWDAKNVYEHLVYTGIIQDTNQVWANNNYLANGLQMSEQRVIEATKLLENVGLIEKIENRVKGKFSKVFLKVLTTDPLSTVNQLTTVTHLNQERFEPETVQQGTKCFREEDKCFREEDKYKTAAAVSKDNSSKLDIQLVKNEDLINYYNDQPNVQKHKGKSSKVYKNIDRFITRLKNGTFGKYVRAESEYDVNWHKTNKLTSLLDHKFTDKEIKKLFDAVNLYFDSAYIPSYKDKISLDNMFYNPRTGKSLAIWLYNSPPTRKDRTVKIKYPDIVTLYSTVAFPDYKFTNETKRNFTIAVNNFVDEIEKLKTKFKKYKYNTNYMTGIYTRHARWIRDTVQGSFAPGNIISTKNGFWDNFVAYLYTDIGFDISPSDDVLHLSRKKAKANVQLKEKETNTQKRAKARISAEEAGIDVTGTKLDIRLDTYSTPAINTLFGKKEKMDLSFLDDIDVDEDDIFNTIGGI